MRAPEARGSAAATFRSVPATACGNGTETGRRALSSCAVTLPRRQARWAFTPLAPTQPVGRGLAGG